MTPRALFWHLIETKYSLTVNHQDLLTRHSLGCLVWKETPLSARLVDSLWPLEPVGRDGFRHSRQTRKHKSRIPCPIFGKSRFPGNSQIPDPVNIFIVFPIPAQYFGQIPNPENTLPDPDLRTKIQSFIIFQIQEALWRNLKNLKPSFSRIKSFTFQREVKENALASEGK